MEIGKSFNLLNGYFSNSIYMRKRWFASTFLIAYYFGLTLLKKIDATDYSKQEKNSPYSYDRGVTLEFY